MQRIVIFVKKNLVIKKPRKVRDHDHCTGICLFQSLLEKKVYANTKNTKKKYVTYNLKFIDSARHMNASLSNLVDILSEINKRNCDSESLKNIKVTYRLINNKKIVRTTPKVHVIA